MKFLKPLYIAVVTLATQTAFAQDAQFTQCIANLGNAASQAGVSRHTFQQYTANLVPDTSLLEKLNYQPEFRTPIWDYLSSLVDD